MASLTDDKLLSKFNFLHLSELKDLLRTRGVPFSSYNKQALVELCFYAVRLGLDLLPTEGEEAKQRVACQLSKLKLGPFVTLPHPSTLDNWNVTAAAFSLPPIMEEEIDEYFAKCNRSIGIDTDGIKARKEGKSLFLSKRVALCQYHNIDKHLGVGYIMAKVHPQTRLNELPYCVWMLLEKATGKVKVADCHCISGLSGCCKHVAAVLYFCASHTVTPACTSKLQIWHQPSQTALEASKPSFLKDVSVTKITAQTDLLHLKNKRPSRVDFDPRVPSMRHKRAIQDYDLDALATATNGNCGLLRYQLRKPHHTLFHAPDLTHTPLIVDVETYRPQTPVTVKTVEQAYLDAKDMSEILSLMSAVPEAVKSLAEATVGQSASVIWESQRIGRLTASRIGTCVQKVSDDLFIRGATHSSVADIMGYYEKANSPPLQWGRNQEPKAIKRYTVHQKCIHQHFKVIPTGLWIYSDAPFISSSPDGLVSCTCCGKGCVEVKCPWACRYSSIANYLQQPSNFIHLANSIPSLKRDHPYYAQVQTHMLCTNTEWCDFVVFTAATVGSILVLRVARDNVFLESLTKKASVFFWSCIIPEMKTRSVQHKVREHYVRRLMDGILDRVEQHLNPSLQTQNTDFLCGSCGAQWSPEDKSVQCNGCKMWFHFKCAKLIGNEEFLSNDSEWFCDVCSVNTKI